MTTDLVATSAQVPAPRQKPGPNAVQRLNRRLLHAVMDFVVAPVAVLEFYDSPMIQQRYGSVSVYIRNREVWSTDVALWPLNTVLAGSLLVGRLWKNHIYPRVDRFLFGEDP